MQLNYDRVIKEGRYNIVHKLFMSAYKEGNCEADTVYTSNFKGQIDYLFYSDRIGLSRVLELPNECVLSEERSLPSSKFPSDHLRLEACFYFV